jgi:hypothetical protein
MRLDPSHVIDVVAWHDRSYAFCSRDCADMFHAAPDRYATT